MFHNLKVPFVVIILTGLLLNISSCKKKPTTATINTSDVIDITQTTAATGGEITNDGNADVTSRGMCWATTIDPTIANCSSTDGSGRGAFTTIIIGLNAGTLYHIRAYATNSAGTSYGKDLQFTTVTASSIIDSSANNGNGSVPDVSVTAPVGGTMPADSGTVATGTVPAGGTVPVGGATVPTGGTVAIGSGAVPTDGGSTGTISGSNGSNNNSSAVIIEGLSYVNSSSNWSGVNIPRSKAINLIFRNNSINCVNSEGYLLQGGDEAPGNTNNRLDGETITGNKFTWNGTNKASTITHGIFVGYIINSIIQYNYLSRVPTGMVLKSNGMTYTTGGVAYNIINRVGNIAVAVKGTNGILVYNNTFYSDEIMYTSYSKPGTAYGIIDIFGNDGLSPKIYSKGTKIKNNIFYTVNQIYNITIEDAQDLDGFESDYNIFWCEAGTPVFNYLGKKKTFAEWQALGYDTHSLVVNPNFNNLKDFVPAVRLDYGTDLGATWATGLSTNASWTVGSAPAVTNQNGHWQIGAILY
jgi:hypothetical protein